MDGTIENVVLPEVGKAERLTLRKGDVVVVLMPKECYHKQSMRTVCKDIGDKIGVPVLILPEGSEVHKILDRSALNKEGGDDIQ